MSSMHYSLALKTKFQISNELDSNRTRHISSGDISEIKHQGNSTMSESPFLTARKENE